MKRALYSLAIFAALAVIAALWFFDTYEQVDTKVWKGSSGEARGNPYLAAMRFAARMGFPAEAVTRPGELDRIAPNATLVLPARRAFVTKERAQSLMDWTRRGGHLVLEPELPRYRDVLLDGVGISRTTVGAGKQSPTLPVQFPDADRALQVTASFRDTLDIGRVHADIRIADAGGVRIVSFRHDAGRISIVTGFQRFSNRAIGAYDNAELLWRILQLSPSNRQMLIFRPPQDSPGLRWLQDHALEIIAAAAALLALCLWRVLPRFGVLQPMPHAQRRQLLEHIRACGRFRWASGARDSLLEAAREICRTRIARQRSRLVLLPKDRYYRSLADELSASATETETAQAFEATPRNAREFVHTVAILARIHGALSRSPGSQPRSKRRR